MVENIILIESGIIINLDASVKESHMWKKIVFQTLLHRVVIMVNIYQVLLTVQWLLVMKL